MSKKVKIYKIKTNKILEKNMAGDISFFTTFQDQGKRSPKIEIYALIRLLRKNAEVS
jgi:hypothetical protein